MSQPTSEPLRRAAMVLELVAMEPSGLAISQIVDRLSLPAPTVFRIVRKLVNIGFLEGSGRNALYRVGPRMHRIAELLYGSEGFSERAAAVMQRLAEELGLAVYLSGLFEDESPIILTRLPTDTRAPIVHPGPQFPVHASAGGKVLLAFQPETELTRFLESGPLRQYTDRTITDPEKLLQELQEIRETGYGIAVGEADQALWGVAHAVRDARGSVIYALGVIGLRDSSEHDHVRDPRIHGGLRSAAEEISTLFPQLRRSQSL